MNGNDLNFNFTLYNNLKESFLKKKKSQQLR